MCGWNCVHLCVYMRQGFSGVNKCTVRPVMVGPEYAPAVKRGVAKSKKETVCSSQSVRAGDAFCVIQVGTVGETGPPATASHDGLPADHRMSVQHAARPANGSMQRMGVLTAEKMRPSLGRIYFLRQRLRGGYPKLPLFVETKKSVPCPSHNMDFRRGLLYIV